jgi:hypothetical protein
MGGNSKMRKLLLCLKIAAIVLPLFSFEGCVMQYQRQYLGDPIMQFDGNDPEEKSLEGHLYPRREGSSGGDGGAGGGCGC